MKLKINGHIIKTDEYVQKWTDWALDATQETDEEITQNVQWLYTQANLKKPKVMIFRSYNEFVNYVGASVRDSVVDSVRDSVWASVRDSVRASVRDSVGAWYWADDLAFAAIFSDAEVLDRKKIKELKKYKEALSTQRLAIYTEKVCYVLVAPIIRRNEQGQLHSTDNLAVDWNGTGLYYLDGIKFEKEWWDKITNDLLSPQEVLAIDNLEHRRIAWKYMDKGKLTGLDSFTVLDEVKDDGKGYPMRIISFNHPDVDEPLKYYNCFCPTTGREYYIGTQETTCAKAKSQSFGFDEINFINEW